MIRTVVGGVLVVLALAGIWFVSQTRGNKTVEHSSPPAEAVGQAPAATEHAKTKLPPPEDFPDVTLTGEDGKTYSSRELAAGGTVVLFIDLVCPPCSEAVQKWQAAYDDHVVDRLFGVTFYPIEQITAYRSAHALTFPIYQDGQQVYKTEHNLTRFPFMLYVGASGIMRGGSYDEKAPIDSAEVASRLAM